MQPEPSTNRKADRRCFLKETSAAAATTALVSSPSAAKEKLQIVETTFQHPDSLVLPNDWESLNPGYWRIEGSALRRRLKNVGERARRTGFPFHYMSKGGVMETDYDPTQAPGFVYRRDSYLQGSYTIKARLKYIAARPEPSKDDDPKWKMHTDGFARMGVAFGAKSLFESHGKVRNAFQAVWTDANQIRLIKPWKKDNAPANAPMKLSPGQSVELTLTVKPNNEKSARIELTVAADSGKQTIHTFAPTKAVEGYVGIVGAGLADFQVESFVVEAPSAGAKEIPKMDCLVCYPLGDTLSQNDDGKWNVRFVGMFASDGKRADIRVADSPTPDGGWENVPIAGSAAIVNNDWRRNTATIETVLPASPADKTLYYTVWKDGVDVTKDSRLGTTAVGPGTGFVGDVPRSGDYVGRLPRLQAPYKLCGLSCHAITSGLQVKTETGYKLIGGGAEWQFRDQPAKGSYQHLDEYNFQIMVWEDDVWYMELVLYPPSTDDAYKVVCNTIAGPASRWQMMRHWNVINPGDHDYGMDDIKGPEQLVIRRVKGLGQDIEYIQRNFKIVHHLITGDEQVDPLANPKKWRAWKMPGGDFTFVILDSRLWRSSQDTDMWDDSGWEKFKSLYDRTDPTRSLLGEEQFAWLQELLATDASRLIGITGINGLHTIWTGGKGNFESGQHPMKFSQRDRVCADYAGWVKAGSDRVLELLGSRDGVVTVYGDVHNGCIMKNTQHGVIECSFGPIGRSGGRGVIPGFGPIMNDVDGREVEIHSLYHKTYADAELSEHAKGDPFYWNFLEMEFDPTQADPAIGLRVRNLIDSPKEKPRGGGSLETTASQTGRQVSCRLPKLTTFADAEVRFMETGGRPIRGTRTAADGSIPIAGLVDVSPGTEIIMIAYDGAKTESKLITTLPL